MLIPPSPTPASTPSAPTRAPTRAPAPTRGAGPVPTPTSTSVRPRRADHRGPQPGSRAPAPPDPGVARGFRTPVRGHAFAGRPPGEDLVVGAEARPVRLVRERDNPADPLAVAVWIDGPHPWRIGYLDRVVAARVAPRLDAGEEFGAQLTGAVDAPGGWTRPLIALAAHRAPAPERAAAPARSGNVWGRPPGVSRRSLPAR